MIIFQSSVERLGESTIARCFLLASAKEGVRVILFVVCVINVAARPPSSLTIEKRFPSTAVRSEIDWLKTELDDSSGVVHGPKMVINVDPNMIHNDSFLVGSSQT